MSEFFKTHDEFYQLIRDKDKFKEFLLINNLIGKSSICSNKNCSDPTDNRLTVFEDNFVFKCNFRKCARRWSARNNIFNFIKCSNLKFTKIFEIIWYTTVKDTSNHTQVNPSTIQKWFNFGSDHCLPKTQF